MDFSPRRTRSRTRRGRGQRQRQSFRKSPDIIVIDSDSEDEDDLDSEDDRKPSANMAAKKKDPQPCISLLESSDEENAQERSPNLRKRKYGLGMAKSRQLDRMEAMDRALAEQLQKEEKTAALKASPRKEQRDMAKSSDGKAVLAVQEIIALVNSAKQKFIANNQALQQYTVEPVTIDDMVFFCKGMLDLQQEFLQKQINGYIDTGYHYTDNRNIANIRTHGLMTAAERQTSNVRAIPKGAVFGDGIYTANNGTNFSQFGDVGLIVGRLQGKAVRVARYLAPSQTVDANTIIGDKTTTTPTFFSSGWPRDDKQHETVLRSSKQCLPMIRFDKAIRQHKEGKECIRYIRASLQQILDRFFNSGMQRIDVKNTPLFTPGPSGAPILPLPNNLGLPLNPPVPTGANILPLPNTLGRPPNPPVPTGAAILPLPNNLGLGPNNLGLPLPNVQPNPMVPTVAAASSSAWVPSWIQMPSSLSSMLPATMPSSTGTTARRFQPQTLRYTAPRSLNTGVPRDAIKPPLSCNMKDECAICFEEMKTRVCVALRVCDHVFHKACIQQAFKLKPECPICRRSIGEPQGKSPSGEMKLSNNSIRCSGFVEDSIVISYNIPSSTQLSYHDNPGTRQGGKLVSAYLPNNTDGQSLCKRLKFAFLHGLTFTVGTSMTTGAPNQCTWASIHHKTSPSGGSRSHGFPDPDYFTNCNGELNALGVPPAKSLDDNGNMQKD